MDLKYMAMKTMEFIISHEARLEKIDTVWD